MSVWEYLTTTNRKIHSIERTNLRKEKVKLFFICAKSDAREVLNFLDKEMHEFHQHITSSNQKIAHMPIPKSTYNTLARAVGKYAKVLTGYANPQDMPEPATNPRTGK
eukprot:2962429-Ditylum_brightwellii.AAC.2